MVGNDTAAHGIYIGASVEVVAKLHHWFHMGPADQCRLARVGLTEANEITSNENYFVLAWLLYFSLSFFHFRNC